MIYIMPGTVDKDKPSALYENLFLDGAVTGSPTEAGFPIGNALTGSTWDYWKPADDTPGYIDVVLPYPVECVDCVFIGAHDMATVGASFEVQADGVTVVESIAPEDNSPIMVIMPVVTASQWRITQTGGPASIGVVMIGRRLVFPCGVDARRTSFVHGHTIEVMGGNSLGGQFLGQKITRKGGNTSVTFPLLESDWVDFTMTPFETHYNEAKPFAFAGNPAFRANDLAYCWRPDRASELRPTYLEGGMYEDFTMEVDFFNG